MLQPTAKSALQVTSRESRCTDFHALTVKELKQLVKDGPQPVERGLLSKLKRKQDIIDYLETTTQTQQLDKEEIPAHQQPNNGSTSTLPPQTNKAPIKTMPMKMPSLDTPIEIEGDANNNDSSATATTKSSDGNKSHLSRKAKIFEQVFERYLPLREQYGATQAQRAADELAAASANDDDDDDAAVINSDIRQIYHPIFESMHNSCDMDIVFVGTASCTPGVTRGVSCTALRLNWRRRAAFQEPTGQANNNSIVNGAATAVSSSGGGEDEEGGTFQGGTWLFDSGECTQLQVQRTSAIRPSKITKIFLTHAHGDHTFGLPGLLCLMGQDRDKAAGAAPIDIYGPEGLRKYLRVAIRYSVSRIVPPYRVHELKEVPMAPEWQYNARTGRYYYSGLGSSPNNRNKDSGGKKQPPQRQVKPWGTQGLAGEDPNSWITQSEGIRLNPSSQYGEVKGGRDIYPIYDHPLSNDGAPVWEVEDEEDVKVYAAPMSHGIPCVGYVVEEASRPGRLRNEIVQPMVLSNLDALKEAGHKIPMKALAVIKNLPVGSAFTFPDGSTITQEEAVEPPRKGRKVVILGDTANCRSMEVLAKDCDVLVHEATNAFLPGIDRDTNLRLVTRDAVIHGHSTPELAGLFAKKVNAKRLLLNHFSARYKGDASVESLSIMMRIEKFAMEASGLNETQVAAAWDLMLFPIRSHE